MPRFYCCLNGKQNKKQFCSGVCIWRIQSKQLAYQACLQTNYMGGHTNFQKWNRQNNQYPYQQSYIVQKDCPVSDVACAHSELSTPISEAHDARHGGGSVIHLQRRRRRLLHQRALGKNHHMRQEAACVMRFRRSIEATGIQ